MSTGNVSIASDVATYTIAADDLPATLGYGEGYTETWDLVFAGSEARTGRRPAILARQLLHCPVTQADLEVEHPGIASYLGADLSSFQTFIDRAWLDCVRRLTTDGRWPEAVVDVDSLHPYTVQQAFFYLFKHFALSGGDGYRQDAEHHAAAAREEWARIRFRVDNDQDGVADTHDRVGPVGVVSRSTAVPWRYRSRPGKRVI